MTTLALVLGGWLACSLLATLAFCALATVGGRGDTDREEEWTR